MLDINAKIKNCFNMLLMYISNLIFKFSHQTLQQVSHW